MSVTGFSDETPRDYHCNLGPDGRRRDADERPELCRGTVEFVATKEFMVSICKIYKAIYQKNKIYKAIWIWIFECVFLLLIVYH